MRWQLLRLLPAAGESLPPRYPYARGCVQTPRSTRYEWSMDWYRGEAMLIACWAVCCA